MKKVGNIHALLARVFAFALVLSLGISFASGAQAQWSDEFDSEVESPERFLLEVGGGPYTPNAVPNFEQAFNLMFNDVGPNLRLEFDVVIMRIPWVGLLGAGVGIGWMEFDAKGCKNITCTVPDGDTSNDSRTDDKVKLSLVPLSIHGLLRVDVLARELKVPVVFTGKLGFEAIHFDISKAGASQSKGFGVGLRWAAQAALELDFLQPRAARSLDDEWGINHSYLFFELYGSAANNKPAVGRDLAFWFGLGLNL